VFAAGRSLLGCASKSGRESGRTPPRIIHPWGRNLGDWATRLPSVSSLGGVSAYLSTGASAEGGGGPSGGAGRSDRSVENASRGLTDRTPIQNCDSRWPRSVAASSPCHAWVAGSHRRPCSRGCPRGPESGGGARVHDASPGGRRNGFGGVGDLGGAWRAHRGRRREASARGQRPGRAPRRGPLDDRAGGRPPRGLQAASAGSTVDPHWRAEIREQFAANLLSRRCFAT
jgi:hypothetical protein